MIEVYEAAPLIIVKYRGISNTHILYSKAGGFSFCQDYCYCSVGLVTGPCLLFSCLCLPLCLHRCWSALDHPVAALQSEYRVKVESENGELG